jgi:hypothetical protein
MRARSVPIVFLLGAGTTAIANSVTIDFEGVPASVGHPGAYTSLTFNFADITVGLDRTSGSAFDVLDGPNWGPFPPSWGNRHLDPFVTGGTVADYFELSFSIPIQTLSIDMGDYNQDSDDLELYAYDTNDFLVDTDLDFLTGTDDISNNVFKTLSISGSGITTVRFQGGSMYPQSVYYDNIVVGYSVIPLPTVSVLAGAGLAIVGAMRRRRMH